MGHGRSHSQLADYLHCGHAFFLKRWMRVPEKPSVWLAGGRAFHETTESFDKFFTAMGKLDSVDEVDREAYQNDFEDRFENELAGMREQYPDTPFRAAGRKTKEKPNGEDADWWRPAGRQMVDDYITWWVNNGDSYSIATLADQPAIEFDLRTAIGGASGVDLLGYGDRLLVDREGRLVVVDLKTGSRMPAAPTQLAGYSIQLELKHQLTVLWGAYYDARKGELSAPVDLSPWTEAKLTRMYSQLDRGIEAGIFIPNISQQCNGCGVRDACVYVGGIEPAEPLPRQPRRGEQPRQAEQPERQAA